MIDKIYFLHHKPATDRLEYIRTNCDIHKIKDYKIIDSHLPETITDEETFKLKKSEVSLTKKHIDALQDAIDNEYGNIIVFEDDIDFDIDFDFNTYISNILEKINDFDIIWIGGVPYVSPDKKGDIEIDPNDNRTSRCTHGMLINAKNCYKWLNQLYVYDEPLDHKYNEIILKNGLKSYWLTPYMYQRTDNGKIKSLIRG